jgi:hypothetical protein
MHLGVREFAAAISTAALIFCCSCEQHKLGEDPEIQKEKSGDASLAAPNKADVVETPAPKRTPAEFFREQSPSSSPSP